MVIGPVSARSAVVWLANANQVLDQVDRGREKLPFRMPDEALDELRAFLCEASAVAQHEPFVMCAEHDPQRLKHMISYWFNVTQLDETQRARLGIQWSPPDGREFGDALAAGVATAMASSPELTDYAARLASAWAVCQPAFAEGLAS